MCVFMSVLSADIHDHIAVHQISFGVYGKTAVSIAVIGKAYIAAAVHHELLQVFDVGGTAVGIDV